MDYGAGLLLLATLLSLHCSPAHQTPVTYDGDKLITVEVTSPGRWQEAENLIRGSARHDFEVWRKPTYTSDSPLPDRTHAHVHVNGSDYPDVTASLQAQNIRSNVLIDDIGRLIRREQHGRGERSKRHVSDINDYYARYDEILLWMDGVAQRYPDVARVERLGKTHEGREMRVLKIGVPGPGKWGVWVDGGVHAREWISSTTVIYLAQQLLRGYAARDEAVMSYLRKLDWYLLPVMNPDGYEYTHTTNRLWRKNRQPSADPACTGVDLNRNWAFMWGGANSDSHPCDRIFRGENPESEREVRAVVDYLMPRADSLIAYLSYHSYGHKFLTPWAYTEREVPPDYNDLIDLAERATAAIQQVHGIPYIAGTAPQLMYPFSGGSADWAKGVANIKYSYLLEIRDDGRYGFLLPAEQIVPTGEEHWAGVRVIADEIIDHYGNIDAPEVVHDNHVKVNRVVLLSSAPTSSAVTAIVLCLLGVVRLLTAS